ncbi:hemin uptake protein HemP [Bremerella sp. T1]|uniref:hemin uptake protein HemP n=1 Tax=Bremerella sp. TYQ1 TaxID=3119568 RepID=UPI001CCD7808|nr:hemin uptake protein HemP [Bremerella volcania]UBM34158.1 hemin uptake protein HemP [Bremerella volcania]
MNTSQQDQQTQPSTPAQDNSPMMKRTISSEEIMAGEKEIWIQHGDSIYRLCETKSGKLILQK